MVITVPDYFHDFHCLAGSCPDTCCGQWEIVVDEAAKARYLSVEGDLGRRIRAALTTRDGEDVMVLENGKCPLLTEDGLCEIVLQKGEDFLSETCHTHPRFTEIYGNLQETMLSISCPEAARLLLTREKPLSFLTTRNDAPPEPTDLEPGLFVALSQGRDTAMAILQRRSLPLSDRLALFLEFAHRLERLTDDGRYYAAQGLSQVLEGVSLTAPRIPLYSNFTGLPYEAASLKENLASQVSHPVRWEAAVRHMIAQGADTFLELGPGKTLSGLIGRIDSGVRAFPVETAEELAQAAKEVRAC